MSQKQIRRLPVVEDGTLIGIISLGDIAVKSRDDQAADTLEDVSQGVKTKSSRQGRQEQQRREPERRAGFTAQQRLDQERGAGRPVSGGRNAKHGIANRGGRRGAASTVAGGTHPESRKDHAQAPGKLESSGLRGGRNLRKRGVHDRLRTFW